MDPATEAHRDALLEAWSTYARRRRAAASTIAGFVFLVVGLTAFAIAPGGELCVADAGVPPTCTSVVSPSASLVLTAVGLVATLSGLWAVVRAVRSSPTGTARESAGRVAGQRRAGR